MKQRGLQGAADDAWSRMLKAAVCSVRRVGQVQQRCAGLGRFGGRLGCRQGRLQRISFVL